MDRQVLLDEIEKHRESMIKLAEKSSFADCKVIEISKKLDDLLNKFETSCK